MFPDFPKGFFEVLFALAACGAFAILVALVYAAIYLFQHLRVV